MADRQTYRDRAVCPKGHSWMVDRRKRSAGKVVLTYCFSCDKQYRLLAGPVKPLDRKAEASNG